MVERFCLVYISEPELVSEMSESYSAPRRGDRRCQDEDWVEGQARGPDGAQGLSWPGGWVIQSDGRIRVLQKLHSPSNHALP